MRLQSLKLRNFRNYASLDLTIPSGVVVFYGDNGQGKTNLIEAIYLLLRGESFRSGAADTMVLQDHQIVAPAALISARLERDHLIHDLQWTAKLGHKRMDWNGKKTTGLQLSREFPIVLFSPESLAAIKEGPEFRRALIDDVLITHSGAAVEVLKQFRKSLRTRNRVLKDWKKGLTTKPYATQLLESLDGVFLPLASELTLLRVEALKAMEPELKEAISSVLDTRQQVEIEYLVSQKRANDWDRLTLMDAMHHRAKDLRSREFESGMTLVGPHRHDIRFLLAGKDSRYFCSQGQQRALILSYKMAQIMYHHRTHHVFPFLLLDDVLSELDPDRRTNLMRFLKDIPSQIFLTTTDLSFSLDFGDRGLSVFRIEKGVIASAGNAESLRRNINSSVGGP